MVSSFSNNDADSRRRGRAAASGLKTRLRQPPAIPMLLCWRLIEMDLLVHVIDPIDGDEILPPARFPIVLAQYDAVGKSSSRERRILTALHDDSAVTSVITCLQEFAAAHC